jgi:hypothetical protein
MNKKLLLIAFALIAPLAACNGFDTTHHDSTPASAEPAKSDPASTAGPSQPASQPTSQPSVPASK